MKSPQYSHSPGQELNPLPLGIAIKCKYHWVQPENIHGEVNKGAVTCFKIYPTCMLYCIYINLDWPVLHVKLNGELE